MHQQILRYNNLVLKKKKSTEDFSVRLNKTVYTMWTFSVINS